MSSSVPVTVVVPVFEGLDEVAGCLDSVVRHAGSSRVAMELLVIDDASPNPAMGPFLDAWAGGVSAGSDGSAGSVPVTVVHHGENLGFVRSVNEGFARAAGDVVILNADTVVTAGWLDRLADAAGGVDVATVTPLTCFGSICTLPTPVIEAFGLLGDDPRIDECGEHRGRGSGPGCGPR